MPRDKEKSARQPSFLVMGLSPNLGGALRRWRTRKGLSLRAAAKNLGVSFPYLQKLETGGRARKPSIDLLQRMAVLYDVSTADMFYAANVRKERIEDARESIDRVFRSLVLHEDLRPKGMDERWLSSFSTMQKQQWIEFAQRLMAVSGDQDEEGWREIEKIFRGVPPLEKRPRPSRRDQDEELQKDIEEMWEGVSVEESGS